MSVHATATTGVPDDADDDADFVCPPFLGIANRLVLAQIVFATLSIIACSAAIAVLCETYIHTYVYLHFIHFTAAVRPATLPTAPQPHSPTARSTVALSMPFHSSLLSPPITCAQPHLAPPTLLVPENAPPQTATTIPGARCGTGSWWACSRSTSCSRLETSSR